MRKGRRSPLRVPYKIVAVDVKFHPPRTAGGQRCFLEVSSFLGIPTG